MVQHSSSTNDQEAARLTDELRVAEYQSVRGEWISSRDAQQHTLQWTLAALVVLFAGIVTSKIHDQHPELYVGLAGAAGLIAILSQAIWFGEVMRMERAALFLRGVELAASRLTRTQGVVPPLSWESWRGSPPERKGDPWIGPASVQILACFCLYFALAGAALAILLFAANDPKIPGNDQRFAVDAAVAVGIVCVLATLYMGVVAGKIWKQKGSAPDLSLPHQDLPEVHACRQETTSD